MKVKITQNTPNKENIAVEGDIISPQDKTIVYYLEYIEEIRKKFDYTDAVDKDVKNLQQAFYLILKILIPLITVRGNLESLTEDFYERFFLFGYFFDQIKIVEHFLFNCPLLINVFEKQTDEFGEEFEEEKVEVSPGIHPLFDYIRGIYVIKSVFSQTDLEIISDLNDFKFGVSNIARCWGCPVEVIKHWLLNRIDLNRVDESVVKGILMDLTELYHQYVYRSTLYVPDDEVISNATKLYKKSVEHVDNAGAFEDIHIKDVLAVQGEYVKVRDWYKQSIKVKENEVVEKAKSEEELDALLIEALKLLSMKEDKVSKSLALPLITEIKEEKREEAIING